MKKIIWIADDETEILALLKDYFQHHGFECRIFTKGSLLLEAFLASESQDNGSPDLIILDIMMPGLDGYEVCRQIRAQSHVPILFLSAKNDELDRLLGLKLGADDYLVKPASPREIVARAEAILRRVAWGHEIEKKAESVLAIELNQAALEVKIKGENIHLTAVEFNLFATLYHAAGRVFNRDELLTAAYTDYRVVGDRTVDSHIKNLRAKLQQVAPGWDLIHSVYGVGYKFVLPETAQ